MTVKAPRLSLAFAVLIWAELGAFAREKCQMANNAGLLYDGKCHVTLLKDDDDLWFTRSRAVEYCRSNGGQAEGVNLTRSTPEKDDMCFSKGIEEPECIVVCQLNTCPLGTYNLPKCTSRCFCHALEACDSITGICRRGGCLDGHFNPPRCQSVCNCMHDVGCDKQTGACPFGCKDGWMGTDCQVRLCPPGFAVPTACNHQCHCLRTDDCNPITGMCSGKCAKGWQGDNCSIPVCNEEIEKCSPCLCSDPACHDPERCHSHDKCPVGWIGPECNIRHCPFGYFGIPNCNYSCHCANDRFCSPLDGDCQGTPCKEGRAGPRCMDAGCPLKRFGVPQCTSYCFCDQGLACDAYNGTCSSGCKKGWQGPHCNERVCPDGTYSVPKCNLQCHCQDLKSCNPVSGVCEDGVCEEGWNGKICGIQFNFDAHNTHIQPWVLLFLLMAIVIGAIGTIFVLQARSYRQDLDAQVPEDINNMHEARALSKTGIKVSDQNNV